MDFNGRRQVAGKKPPAISFSRQPENRGRSRRFWQLTTSPHSPLPTRHCQQPHPRVIHALSPKGVLRCTPRGESRYNSGTPPTNFAFTGQRKAEAGLYFYNARFYDPALAHFISADTLIPGAGNPLAWNRYAYTLYNPVRYVDPSGHVAACDRDDWTCQTHWDYPVIPKYDDKYTFTKDDVEAIIPDGRKESFTFAIGMPSNLRARLRNNMKIPTTLYFSLSLVSDNAGYFQLFLETLDISFDPRLVLGDGELVNSSELAGAGASLTRGLIWKEDFRTTDYMGRATSWGGSLDIITADYYESFPGKNLKGLDVGVSAGFPVSGWRISTYAHQLTPPIPLFSWLIGN